ncbi:MAG: class I SAM-dependent RNA methyltransferase [Clostridia bacterium]|nr:class I SAM-dependent RNA methyltransferase [Clostridia bacterium]
MVAKFTNDEYTLSIAVSSGLEKVAKKELFRLGYPESPALNGKIEVKGSLIDIARLNVFLRTAERVYIKLAEFDATSFDELFDGVSKIPFENFIESSGKIIVNGKCVKSKIYAISACQKIVKKAVTKRLCDKYSVNFLSETGSEYEIVFSIFKDRAEILLNTTGVALHKRGYKNKVWIAPIKETLASAIVLMSDYYYNRPLADPFCGSGTIPIEASLIALNIAPGKNREFAFDKWKGFDKNLKKRVIEEALDKEELSRKIEVYGTDIDKKAIELAKYHAKNAGLEDRISFKTRPVKEFKTDSDIGTIICNPPYGERVYDRQEAETCYQELGVATNKLLGWSKFIITSAKNFEKKFGNKADRERKLYNSEKECRLYYYYGKKGD